MKESQHIITPNFLDQSLPGLEELSQDGWQINRIEPSGNSVILRIAGIHAGLAKIVQNVIESGRKPVSLTGDCCTALGVLAGLVRSGFEPQLIWFDAHGDECRQ